MTQWEIALRKLQQAELEAFGQRVADFWVDGVRPDAGRPIGAGVEVGV